ncbi:MAG: enoyl-CoA hydratase-related protein [Deltaproteobacteria bacterium]|jgi:enoyl-CoA hydratase/carnithine racemase
MNYENLLVEKKGNICIITLNHPPVNAWNWGMMADFEKALEEVETDKSIRVLIITGGGDKAFSAGFDLSDAANAQKTSPKGRELWTRLDRFEKPVIAAINGHVLAGGLELALCCHFRIMVDHSDLRIGLTELNVGIIPGWGGTQRLTRIVGKAKALNMILFSATINPEEALEVGLVNQLSTPERLLPDALSLAQKLVKRPPLAMACVLRAISAGEYEGFAKGLQAEEEGNAIVSTSKDRLEGFSAFLEKREPVFTGE